MKNVLLLHGSGNNSQGNWFPWLKKELEEKGFKVWVPNLPHADYPDISEWVDFIFSSKNWEFNKESLIIGHSAGATLILGLLQNLPSNKVISKAILVAGCVSIGKSKEKNRVKQGLLKSPFNWNKIKQSAQKFYFIHSDNDRYECGIEQGMIMQQYLGGELIFKPGEDHFNLETSPKYKKFPLLLELIG